MIIVELLDFIAANGAQNPKKLAPGIGVSAANLDTSQGDFRGHRGVSLAHTLTGLGTQQISLYRMGRDTPSDTQYWLTSSSDVDYARSLIANDTTERTYYTDGAKPKYTDNTLIGSPPYPTAYVDLGVPTPSGSMTATLLVAGTGPDETRIYTQTFVRANGDESAPTTATVSITVKGGSTVTLGSLAAAPAGSHGITNRRIYVTTGGEFQQCLQQSASSTSGVDDGVTRGAVLQTGGSTTKPYWLTPPDTMKGILPLWNGMHGAFYGKQYMVCQPFEPHAWPAEYRRSLPDTVVGTASWGENWLIVTTGLPRLVTGSSPLGMGARPIYIEQAGVSKRSVKSVGHGVCWASNDGLCYHGQLGTKVLTEMILTKAQWRALVPSSIIGASWGRYYIGFYNDGTRKAFMIDTTNPVGLITFPTISAYGVFEDSVSETLYMLGTSYAVNKWDAGSQLTAQFKSRVFRHPVAVNPGAARVIGTTYPVTFTLWADGVLKYNVSVTSDRAFKLPGSYVAEEFQVEIQGTGPVEAVFVAEAMRDLP